ncbi:hypothetical protein P389DRAFT_21901 [Cystobasidium minutum MCA 4210]|uniref:uncharacterized protein n=1 Tax=Cystobasidium minutum MCA 4210 TaxID=1397322 RepID=UPI0034CECFBF|eukprot:jgi/Rhomi1/21901/CE21900_1560
MRGLLLASIALVTGALAQTTSKVDPPSRPNGPGYYIADDIDYIATAGANATACPSVQAIRSKCYSDGKQAKSLAAEWKCLCDPDAAYAVTQCFAKNYQKLSGSAKSNYYEDFLYYTYDCYCGVTQTDVTYNTTRNPPAPYIRGYTGDAILPPEGGCPASNPGSSGGGPTTSKPPCGCVPPVKPDKPGCQAGYSRVGKSCVKDPEPPEGCDDGRIIDENGKCVCPSWSSGSSGTGTCPGGPPDFCKGPNEFIVIGIRDLVCLCKEGYSRDSAGNCIKDCGPTEIPNGSGGCVGCPPNQIRNYDDKCLCPVEYGYTVEGNDCVRVVCTNPNEEFSQWGGCVCKAGYYRDHSQCVPVPCGENDTNCSPQTGDNTTVIPSEPAISSVPSDMPSMSPILTDGSSIPGESDSTSPTIIDGGPSVEPTPSDEPPTGPTPSPVEEGGGDPTPSGSEGGGEAPPDPTSGPSPGDGSGGDDSGGGSSGGSGGDGSGGDGSGGSGGSGGGGSDGGSSGGSGDSGGGGGGSSGGDSGGGSSGESGGSGGGDGGGGDSGGGGGGSTPTRRARVRQRRHFGRWN